MILFSNVAKCHSVTMMGTGISISHATDVPSSPRTDRPPNGSQPIPSLNGHNIHGIHKITRVAPML